MEKQGFLILKTLLVLVVISESAVIGPRRMQKDGSSEDQDIPRRISVPGKDMNWEPISGIRNSGKSSVEYDDDTRVNNPGGQPSDYDYGRPEDNDNTKPEIKPGIIPEEDEPSDTSDEENFEPYDEVDPDKAVDVDDEGEESKPSTDEGDEKVPEEDSDDGKFVPDEEGGDKDKDEPGDEDDEKPVDEDDGKPVDEDDGKPVDEDDGSDKELDDNYDDNRNKNDWGYFFGGSIFDTPFFNLNKARTYFYQMERALGRVFRQTLDEARLLNGTYANTTEEEVQIGGKKYIVQKSIIKGADDRSSIYVETISTKPKSNNSKGIKDTDMKKKND